MEDETGAQRPSPPPAPRKYEPPVHFADVGKHAKNLVHMGFVKGHMLMVSCLGPRGSILSTTASIIGGITVGMFSATFQEGRIKNELTFNTATSQILSSTTCTNLGVPGLTAGLETVIPGAVHQGKTQVTYQRELATIGAKIHGLKTTPDLEFSVNVGSKYLSAGGSVMYSSSSNSITNAKTGFSYATEDFTTTFLLDPVVDKCFDAYFTRVVSPEAEVGSHVTHQMEKGLTSATVSGQYLWDKQTIIKARMDDRGMLATLLQYSPNPLVTFGLLTEFNGRDLSQKPNIGLSLSVLAAAPI